jgi:eukaryotic-like serine/threonine-protein kinase
MFRHDPAHTGASNSSAPIITPSVLWSFKTSAWIICSPAIVNDHIYFTDYTGNFYCLNTSTGAKIWNARGQDSPAVNEGTVYVGNNLITAYNSSTGTTIWSDQTLYESEGASPVVAGGIVYTSYNGFHVYNASTGVKIWNYTESDQFSPPAISNGIVYYNGYYTLLAFDASTGTIVWQFTPKNPGTHYHLSSPAIDNGRIYAGLYDGFYCLDASTGKEVWNYSKGGFGSSPAVADGIVYFGNQDYNVYALNASTGEKIWSYTTGYVIDSSPAVANGAVYVGSSDGNLYALNSSNGAKLWNFTLQPFLDEHGNRRYLSASPAIANGIIYMGSSDGTLYALTIPKTLAGSQSTSDNPDQICETIILAAALLFTIMGLIIIRNKRAVERKQVSSAITS